MRWALVPIQRELGTPPTSPTSSRATGRGPMSELRETEREQHVPENAPWTGPGPRPFRERERASSMCHERSGRTSPKRAGAALSLHHQGRPCGSPVLRSGALSWHLSTCGTNEIDFSLSLPCIRIRVGTEAVDWAGPSVLPRSRPLLPLSRSSLPPPQVGAPSEIRVCRAIALWTGLGPRSFLPSFLCFSLSIFLSLSFSLIGPPPY